MTVYNIAHYANELPDMPSEVDQFLKGLFKNGIH